MKKLLVSVFVVLVVLPWADGVGGELIRQALNRNASEFDLFLSKLDGQLRCRDGREAAKELCTNSIQFQRDTQIITATFNLSSTHPLLADFNSNITPVKREEILEAAIEEIAIKIGVMPLPDTGSELRVGEIQKVAYEIRGLDMDAFREEVAKNVVIEMFVRDEASVFWTIRGIEGQTVVLKIDRKKLEEKVN